MPGQEYYQSQFTGQQIDQKLNSIPTKVSDLTNDSGFIANTVNNLVNYYLKSDTYSKSEVDSIINTIKNGRFQNVNSLPEQDIDTNVIYLVQKQNTENNNIKDEYINLDGTSTGWEKIGSTEINLDGYVTIQALNTALSNYVQSSNIVTILANKTSFSSVENMVATSAADLYDGCLAYVTATKKNYQYDSTNETDPTLGKWRELQTGGGGGTDYTAGDGIDITDDTISIDPMPAEDMDEVIDELPTGGNIAVTGYVPLGTLISYYGETAPEFFLACDGSTYNKADYPELAKHLLSLTNNTPYIVDGDNTKFKVPDLRGEFIRGTGSNRHSGEGGGSAVGVHQGATQIPYFTVGTDNTINFPVGSENNQPRAYESAMASVAQKRVTGTNAGWTAAERVRVRPTNTSVLFCIAYKDIYSNPMNDYSTDEKVVGTWINGETLYQKTLVIDLSTFATIDTTRQYVDLLTVNTSIGIVFIVNGYHFDSNCFNPIVEPTGDGVYSLIRVVKGTGAYRVQGLSEGTNWLRQSINNKSGNVVLTVQYTKA